MTEILTPTVAPAEPLTGSTRRLAIPPPGAFCDHAKMAEYHKGCGHFACPCGIAWDEGAEGEFFETYEGEFAP